MTRPPIISLTTDFGLTDPYVGTMKGVIAGICPTAQVIDITHGVEAFSILDGGLAIWRAWRYFPAETIHVVVVDPGVGSERQAVLTRMGDHWFIAPDNGVLTMVEREVRRAGGGAEYRQIENSAYMLPVQSHTFHGRDVFAPAAAHLALQIGRGHVDAESFGPEMQGLVQLPVPTPVRTADGCMEGVVLKVDRFGNLLTNLTAGDLSAEYVQGTACSIRMVDREITKMFRYYAEAGHEEPEREDATTIFAILGSTGLLEFSIHRGSAHAATGAGTGTRFTVLPQARRNV